MQSVKLFAASLVAVALAGSDGGVFAKGIAEPTHGKVALKSADVVGFGPEGILLVGDGTAAAIYAIQTDEGKSSGKLPAKIDNIDKKLAAAVGAPAGGVEILDLAVNPQTGTAYISVRKQDDKASMILTVKGDGQIGLFDLDSVDFARVQLPTSGEGAVTKLTDVAWADDKLIAAGSTSGEFASKIFVVQTPLKKDSQGDLHAAETYHVQHHKWETKSPMTSIMPFEENGETYLAGAFACTPVVKYPIDSLQPGAKVTGKSVLEIGSGNRPLDMFTYSKGGKEYVLANTQRFHHERKPFGPSPFWTVRFDRDLLGEEENVNEKALLRLKGDMPATDKITLIEAFHGVRQMDRLGENEALVLKENTDKGLDLAVLALP